MVQLRALAGRQTAGEVFYKYKGERLPPEPEKTVLTWLTETMGLSSRDPTALHEGTGVGPLVLRLMAESAGSSQLAASNASVDGDYIVLRKELFCVSVDNQDFPVCLRIESKSS